jgi:small subunit ribosomal protein S8
MSGVHVMDMLTRIRNACAVQHRYVDVINNGTTKRIANILVSEKFILNFDVLKDALPNPKYIRLYLKYTTPQGEVGLKKKPVIQSIKAVSTPGRKVYVNTKDKAWQNSLKKSSGLAILSTSQGVLTQYQAIERNIGGEILCYIN